MISIKDRESLIFLHLVKTAGTTLRFIIEPLYGTGELYLIYPGEEKYNDPADLKKLSEEEARKIKLFFGHIGYGIHEDIPQSCAYATILREPVDRVISHYHHIKDTSVLAQYEDDENKEYSQFFHTARKASGMEIEEFVSSGILHMITDNHQTRVLSNRFPDFGKCNEEMLEIAKKNIQEHFALVGFTERFDETLVLMKRLLGWHIPFYVKQNVTQKRSRLVDLPESTINLIKENNRLDIELYKYANEIFDKQVGEFGTQFQTEVDDLKAANAYTAKVLNDQRMLLVSQKDRHVNALLNSMSWRITAPLRWACRLVRRNPEENN